MVWSLYSPDDGPDGEEYEEKVNSRSVRAFARKVKKFIENNKIDGHLDYTKVNVNIRGGKFEYRTVGKKQNFTIDIKSIDDALFISAIITDRLSINGGVPVQFRKAYNLFNNAESNDEKNLYRIRKKLEPWINPHFSGRGKNKKVVNPLTNINIKIIGRSYKQIFKKIRLKQVKYEPLHNFNSIDYKVDEYCVPSYLKNTLLKREWKLICDKLEDNKTPTYVDLTTILNEIDYNLNVYILDGESLQTQTQYNKTLSILIHDDHMYVLKNNKIDCTIKKTVGCTADEFDKIKTEYHTESTKIHNSTKYKRICQFSEFNKKGFRSSYSKSNLDFFNESCIRPVRYYDDVNDDNDNMIDYVGLDINACYPNILHNQSYLFPVQDGTEITEIYNNEPILGYGFYYVTFKKMSEIEKALFSKSCWLLGDVILTKKLQKTITIKFKHITKNACTPFEKDDNFTKNKLALTFYSGYLASTIKTKSKIYHCSGLEAEAYQIKYPDCIYHNGSMIDNDNVIEYKSSIEKDELLIKYPDGIFKDSHIEINDETNYKTSGLYTYLAILQYARLQLYQLYDEVKKLHNNIKIKKIYTDSLSFTENIINDNQINKLNKILLKKYGFSVKSQKSDYQFEWKEINVPEPVVIHQNDIHHTDIKKLLLESKSFAIDSKAGYGKTHMIKHQIIPVLNENNKKYILASSTIASSQKIQNDNLDCVVINSILLTKESSLNNLNKIFKNIDYLIIDEMSRLSMNLLYMIQYLKSTFTNLKFILVGDKNQCDFNDLNLMESHVFKSIIDYNILTIKWHKNARYSKDYDNFLTMLLTFKDGGRDPQCINYVKSYFKTNVKSITNAKSDMNTIKLSYTNNMRKSFNSDTAITTHKSQGDTINEKYSIYEIEKMNVKILYTAFSRCTNPNLIHIYI